MPPSTAPAQLIRALQLGQRWARLHLRTQLAQARCLTRLYNRFVTQRMQELELADDSVVTPRVNPGFIDRKVSAVAAPPCALIHRNARRDPFMETLAPPFAAISGETR